MSSSDALPTAELDVESFRAIAGLAYEESGLTLVEEKTTMIQSRLRHRLRALGLAEFSQYSAFVCSSEGQQERRHLISALTTNVSHFFREAHHFDYLNTFRKVKKHYPLQ
jgi:chemotaxis protein methyltransferase CheR